MYSGACLCGAVRFQLHGPIRNIIHCHCSECRRAQGTAFATNGIVKTDDFVLVSGEQLLTGYAVNQDQTKFFCSLCGSPIMSKRKLVPDQLRVRLGTITSDIAERPSAHIFVSSKANWEEISGDLPWFDGYEKDRFPGE